MAQQLIIPHELRYATEPMPLADRLATEGETGRV